MIKLDLINEVVTKTGVTKTKAEMAVETVFESMKNALAKGDRIELRGFGVFTVRPRKTGIVRDGDAHEGGARVRDAQALGQPRGEGTHALERALGLPLGQQTERFAGTDPAEPCLRDVEASGVRSELERAAEVPAVGQVAGTPAGIDGLKAIPRRRPDVQERGSAGA